MSVAQFSRSHAGGGVAGRRSGQGRWRLLTSWALLPGRADRGGGSARRSNRGLRRRLEVRGTSPRSHAGIGFAGLVSRRESAARPVAV